MTQTPPSQRPPRAPTSGSRKFLYVVSSLFLIGILAWKAVLYRHHLSFVPDEMNVGRVLYVAEKSWGFGPGGNETGIIVYKMPNETRQKLASEGLAWLETTGPYKNWSATPLPPTLDWTNPQKCGELHDSNWQHDCPSITGYMNQYGFGISVEPDIVQLVDNAIFAPGAFYAFGRSGIVIAIPEQSRFVYVYSG